MIDIQQQIKEAIETENIAQLTTLLWANVPSENNEQYIYHKQQTFNSFVRIAHLLWLRDKQKISLLVKQIIIILHKIGFVSKRRGDMSAQDSKKLLDILGQIEAKDCKQFELDEVLLRQLNLFLESLNEAMLERTDLSMIENTTMMIRRKDDIPTLKQKKN